MSDGERTMKRRVTSGGTAEASVPGGSHTGAEPHARSDSRRRLDIRLQAVERRYAALVRAIPDLVLRVDRDGTCLECHTGTQWPPPLSANQVLGSRMQGLLPRSAVERRMAAMRRALDTGREQTIEYELPAPQGPRLCEERCVASGPDEVILLVRDITDARRMQQALRDTEEKLWSLFEHVPDYIATLRPDGTFLFLNRAQPGAKLHRVLGTSIYEHLPAEQRDRARRVIDRAVATAESGSFDASFASPRGETRLYSCRVGAVKRRGEVVALTLVATDVTDRESALTALQESEERYRTLIENLRDAIYTTSRNGRIIDFNQAALDMFGYGRDELPDLSVYDFYVDSSDRERMAAQIERSESVGDFELKLRKKDGTVIDCVLTASARRARDGTLVGYQGILRDVTTRKRLEREMLEFAAREQRRIGQDLHDGLGQHLTGLAFLSKVLTEKLAAKALAEARDAAKIQELITEALAQTRKLAKGLQPVALETGGLGLALEELASHVSSLFGIQCTCRLSTYSQEPDDTTAINVYHIAREAVTNAVKHAHARTVAIDLCGAESAATLTVTDDGIGIPTIRDQREGLGLHIMRYRAGMIAATLTIGPRESGGTVVSCRFATGRRQIAE
jgi:PAS domain S-box-containing protein